MMAQLTEREHSHEEVVTTFKKAMDMVRDAGLIFIDEGLFGASDVVAGALFTLRRQYELFSAELPGQSDPSSDQRPGAVSDSPPFSAAIPEISAAAVTSDRSLPVEAP